MNIDHRNADTPYRSSKTVLLRKGVDRVRVLALIALAGAFITTGATASERDLAGARLYATCANCHGTAGNTVGQVLPPLAGQPKENIIASMNAFKNGSRPATIMHQIAKGYTPEQIEAIAAYLAGQKQ